MALSKRQTEIVMQVALLWGKAPHLRFGQLVSDIAGGVDPFYIEDHVFLSRANEFEKVVEKCQKTDTSKS